MWKYLLFLLIIPAICMADTLEGNNNFDKIYDLLKSYPSEVLDEKGREYLSRNKTDSALICYTIISNRFRDNMDVSGKKLCALAYNNCGLIYIFYTNYTKAYTNFLKAVEIGDESVTYSVYNNIASIYHYYGDIEKAEEYLDKSYYWNLKNSDWHSLMVIYHNIINQNYLVDSLGRIENKLWEFKRLNIPENYFYNYILYTTDGMLNVLHRDYEKAIYNFKSSINYTDSLWMPERYLYSTYSNLAKVYSLKGDYSSAIGYMKKGEIIALENNYSEIIMGTYRMLEDYYEKSGDEKSALSYRLKFINIRDSIFNATEFGKIKDLQSFFEIDKIEKKVTKLTDEKRLREVILLIVFGALGLIIVFFLWTFRQNRRLAQINKSLFQKNIEIMKSEEAGKAIREESELKSKMQESKISEYEKKLKQYEGALPAEMQEGSDEKSIDRYKSSKLSDENRVSLLEAIRNVMDDNILEFCSESFSLEKLATMVNSNSKYVSQVINEDLGKNFSTFLNEYRMREARKRLMDFENYGNVTNEAIGMELGFKSRSNFGRTFKKFTGLTPSEYQRLARRDYHGKTSGL